MAPHLSLSERWRIITLRNDFGLSMPAIAHRSNYSLSTIHRILDLFSKTNEVAEREGRGRKRPIQGSVRRQFREIMRKHPSATSKFIAERLESRTGVCLSDRTIRRTRRQENYHPVHSKTHWTINSAQTARRFQFSVTHLFDDWHDVIFTDEKKFEIDQRGKVYWIPIGCTS
ncbi:unnamed protein product [Didymodactylos carnosus]|uniref:Transposase Tc1-like domain-containing protein n=1 Tax=Didymodactylos carnosus TaxID=1234261 RepID=A0A815FK59_9BILA|nr:unnamed protein product [Didymodactylos carnosus]CAF1326445.1 unnamed protein product [Didymodactylos carnosus]CAF4098068.1 unnamed protein product [Didymodactylos carnosus]CAF4176504.1 unnamed protein product [Didymodactylos carnosus]